MIDCSLAGRFVTPAVKMMCDAPLIAAGKVSGFVTSPSTISTPSPSELRALDGLRARARTAKPSRRKRLTIPFPVPRVAPITSTGPEPSVGSFALIEPLEAVGHGWSAVSFVREFRHEQRERLGI